MNKQLLTNLLQMLGLEQNSEWGKFKIEVLGYSFDSVEAIPPDFLKKHPEMDRYHVKITQTKKQLEAFIVYRLVDKLSHQYQRKELRLTQQKIPALILDEEFMGSFVAFLKAQTLASVYNDLENRILKSMRNGAGQIQQHYRAKTPLRQHNVTIRKFRSEDADKKWEQVVAIASRF